MRQRVFQEAGRGTWYSERVTLPLEHWLLGWRSISSLYSADESQEGKNSCPVLRSWFISQFLSCFVSWNVFHAVWFWTGGAISRVQELRIFYFYFYANVPWNVISICIIYYYITTRNVTLALPLLFETLIFLRPETRAVATRDAAMRVPGSKWLGSGNLI